MFDSILNNCERLGAKLSHFFGDVDLGTARDTSRQRNENEKIFAGIPFADFLPYESFDEERGLFIGKNSLGFVLEALPLVGADQATEQIVSSLFSDLLDEDSSIQFLLFADHRIDPFLDAWQVGRVQTDDTLSSLVRRRVSFFRTSTQVTPRVFRLIISYSIPCGGQEYSKLLAHLKEKKDKLLETFKQLTHAVSWRPEDLLELVGGLVNFSPKPNRQKRSWNPHQTLASQVPAGGKVGIEEEQLEWITDSETIFRSYRTVDLPEYHTLNHMQALIGDVFRDAFRVRTPFFIHYGVHMPKQSLVESSYWRRTQLIENQGRSYSLLRWIPDLEKELKENGHIRKCLSEGAKFVWTQISTGLWGSHQTINQSEQVLKALFRINHFLLTDNRYVHLPQFIAALPMTWAEYVPDLKKLNLLRTTISTECTNFVPLHGEWAGTPTPGMLLMGRRGQLLNWCPFDNRVGNYNVVVVGRSGAGKSVFMQDLLVSGMSAGARVFILDVGRSFERMCDLVQGQKIEFSKESTICLNPFTHISQTDADERDTAFTFLKSVVAFMAAPSAGTTDYENAIIETAIKETWEKHQTSATISDVSEWLCAHEDPRVKILGTMLMPYTRFGVYAKHFEGRNNVSFSRQLVLIELEELKEKKDLQAVVLQLFIMEITNAAFLGDRKTPFYLCIDEAWDLLRGKQSGPFIETLARRLRKYNGSLVIGTQSIEDFFATPGARAAFDNSDWMCLLSQKKSSIGALADSHKLDLDDSKRAALESVTTRHGEYSEVMICDADRNHTICRLVLDPFSELLYTTKADEFVKLQELQKHGYTISQAIEKLLLERGSV